MLLLYGNVKISVYKLLLNKMLSKKRFIHSINVASQAMKLAENYGEDANKAYLAGLLHDICKEMSPEKQKELIIKSTLDVSEIEMKAQPLWHAIAGAEYINHNLKICDIDIINSIRYHTVARANMSSLEKIIYLADLVSIDRDYKDVKKMRKLCYKDINKAMAEALKFSILDSIEKENSIPSQTLEAYNQYVTK